VTCGSFSIHVPSALGQQPSEAAYQRVGFESDCGCDDDLSVVYDGECDSYGCDSPGGTKCGCAGYESLLGLSRDADSRSPFFINSWIAQGFTGNPDNPENGNNLPVTFNDRANEYLMNQLYLSVGKEVQQGDSVDIGGRLDLLYGTDSFFTTSRGLEVNEDGTARWNGSDGRGPGSSLYGLAMPQLYAEIYAPIGNGVTIKAGHFYTIIGYESVMAPENFFYSHSYSMQYGQPFTHTGILANIAGNGGVDVQAGITQGWDTWSTGQVGFLGGFTWSNSDDSSSFAFAISTGDEDNLSGIGDPRANRTAFTTVLEKAIGSRGRYALEQVFGTQQDAAVTPNGTKAAQWYGINQYFFYDIRPDATLGMRVEWFKDDDNARVLGIPVDSQTEGGNYVGITSGINFQPTAWLNVRPEIRYDWSDAAAPIFGQQAMFNDFEDDNQLTLSFDAIIQL
jgi:hypothetical protein